MLNGYKRGVGRIYDARLQKVQGAIDSAVLVDDESRNYSIICALLCLLYIPESMQVSSDIRMSKIELFQARMADIVCHAVLCVGMR